MDHHHPTAAHHGSHGKHPSPTRHRPGLSAASPGTLLFLSSAIFKPLVKRLEICEEVVATLERALPNDEHKVRKVELETLQ
jgi:hypothetical protein